MKFYVFFSKLKKICKTHTNTAKTYGLRSKEHEIVAVLHASDDTIAIEVLPHRSSEGLEICFR